MTTATAQPTKATLIIEGNAYGVLIQERGVYHCHEATNTQSIIDFLTVGVGQGLRTWSAEALGNNHKPPVSRVQFHSPNKGRRVIASDNCTSPTYIDGDEFDNLAARHGLDISELDDGIDCETALKLSQRIA